MLVAMVLVGTGCELIASVDSDLIKEDDVSSARGALGGYKAGHVFGWAALADDGTATVTIEVNGSAVGTVKADDPRPDLVDAGVHSTGNAGFDLEVGDLESGDEVSAIIEETGQELTGSPITVP
jgi:hypothetical protein